MIVIPLQKSVYMHYLAEIWELCTRDGLGIVRILTELVHEISQGVTKALKGHLDFREKKAKVNRELL